MCFQLHRRILLRHRLHEGDNGLHLQAGQAARAEQFGGAAHAEGRLELRRGLQRRGGDLQTHNEGRLRPAAADRGGDHPGLPAGLPVRDQLQGSHCPSHLPPMAMVMVMVIRLLPGRFR